MHLCRRSVFHCSNKPSACLHTTYDMSSSFPLFIDRFLLVLRGGIGLYQHVILSFHFHALIDMWLIIFGWLSVIYLERRDSNSMSHAIIKQYARLLTNPFGTIDDAASHFITS